jgi:hypothetical protein
LARSVLNNIICVSEIWFYEVFLLLIVGMLLWESV